MSLWSEEENFPYELWQDSDRVLSESYGAASDPDPIRQTVILDEQGDLLLVYPFQEGGVSPGRVLKDCRILFP